MITEIDVDDANQYGTTAYDGWIGLGYELINADSVGFMARAVYSGLLAKNVYSYEPTKTGANLVLGGYNATNFKSNYTIIHNNSTGCWNSTLTSFNFGGSNMW